MAIKMNVLSISIKFTGVLLFVLQMACGTESSIINSPPSSVSISAELEEVNPSFTYTFNGSAKDREFDELTYTWTFSGSSDRKSGKEITQSFEKNKNFTVILTVSDGKEEAADSIEINTTVSSVSVDPGTRFQKVEGFGGFGAAKPWWTSPPFFDQDFVQQVTGDLGLTILRDNIPSGFEFENDNDDPFDLNLDGFNLTEDKPEQDGPLADHFEYLIAMKEAGVEKFITSIWSPPAWMKECNCVRGEESDAPDPNETDHKLDSTNYQEFAEYCVAYVKVLKEQTGIDLYALSVQNEPAFVQTFASSVYSPEELAEVIKIVGNRFEEEGIDTKLFFPEDVVFFSRIKGFIDAVIEDDSARTFSDIIAIHNYNTDGVSPGDNGPTNWAQTDEIARQYSHQVWMTETSGFEANWEGAMTYAQSMYNALKFGKTNAWVFWSLSSSDPKFSLISDGTPNPVYHISKQFYRFVRPGAVQVKSESDDSDLLVLAYNHPEQQTETIILINLATVGKAVNISSGVSTSSFQQITSSEEMKTEEVGSVHTGDDILLPAQSITTLSNQ